MEREIKILYNDRLLHSVSDPKILDLLASGQVGFDWEVLRKRCLDLDLGKVYELDTISDIKKRSLFKSTEAIHRDHQ